MNPYQTLPSEPVAETDIVIEAQAARPSREVAQLASRIPGSPTRRSSRHAVEVPDLTDLEVPAAIQLARTSALSLGVAKLPDPTSGNGRVVSQRPAPGTHVRRGSRIHVYVAGTCHVPVPDVCLASEPDAIDRIVMAGLRPGNRDPRPRPVSGRAEVVIRTRPRAGTSVPLGSRVDYELLPAQRLERSLLQRGYEDFDAASTIEDRVQFEVSLPDLPGRYGAASTRVAAAGYVDYDSIDTWAHTPAAAQHRGSR